MDLFTMYIFELKNGMRRFMLDDIRHFKPFFKNGKYPQKTSKSRLESQIFLWIDHR